MMNTYPINKQATKIMNRLMELYDKSLEEGNDYLKLDNNPNYMYLAVEKPYSEDIISLAHYGRQNGDSMRDPEMLFLKKDDRCYPMYYHNDYVGVVQESMFKSGDKMKVNPSMQKGQADFANMWLRNIKDQQEL